MNQNRYWRSTACVLMASAAAGLPACGGEGGNAERAIAPDAPLPVAAPAPAPEPGPTPPVAAVANETRGIASTFLAIDTDALTGTATIVLEPSDRPGATFEIGDLAVLAVTDPATAAPLAWTRRGDRLDIGIAAAAAPLSLAIHYRFKVRTGFDGYRQTAAGGSTVVWPYHCGNLFPCHSRPDDGTAFSVAIKPPANGQKVIAATGPMPEAPSYQVAWALGDYTDLELGTTAGGTRVTVSYLPGQLAQARQGSANLAAAFGWFETVLGPYRFGAHAGAVAVDWGPGATGGMEHHPRWHVPAASLADAVNNVHEAAHGWFGAAVRIACWEDFVLSEGTASYLTGRALDVVAPEAGADVWRGYEARLRSVDAGQPTWPMGCHRADVLKDRLYSDAPYMRGAFFYRAVAARIGAGNLDRALSAFYRSYAGKAATMDDMLATLSSETGYDPKACARHWLRGATIPAPGPCP